MTMTDKTRFTIRRATPNDIPQIRSIEKAASSKFREITQLAALAESECLTTAHIQNWLDKGPVWIACDTDTAKQIGFAAAYPLDRILHLAEISVLEESSGHGVGSMLINALLELARQHAHQEQDLRTARCSLRTYADVPWNGPFYQRRGFREVPASALGPEHVALSMEQSEVDLARLGFRRCCMLWTEILR